MLTFDNSQDLFQEKGKEEKVKNEMLVFEPSINDSGNDFSQRITINNDDKKTSVTIQIKK